MKKRFSVELSEDRYIKLKNIADREFRSVKSNFEKIVCNYLDSIDNIES